MTDTVEDILKIEREWLIQEYEYLTQALTIIKGKINDESTHKKLLNLINGGIINRGIGRSERKVVYYEKILISKLDKSGLFDSRIKKKLNVYTNLILSKTDKKHGTIIKSLRPRRMIPFLGKKSVNWRLVKREINRCINKGINPLLALLNNILPKNNKIKILNTWGFNVNKDPHITKFLLTHWRDVKKIDKILWYGIECYPARDYDLRRETNEDVNHIYNFWKKIIFWLELMNEEGWSSFMILMNKIDTAYRNKKYKKDRRYHFNWFINGISWYTKNGFTRKDFVRAITLSCSLPRLNANSYIVNLIPSLSKELNLKHSKICSFGKLFMGQPVTEWFNVSEMFAFFRFAEEAINIIKRNKINMVVALDKSARILGIFLFHIFKKTNLDIPVQFISVGRLRDEFNLESQKKILKNKRILVVDDYISTGGTLDKIYRMMDKLGSYHTNLVFGTSNPRFVSEEARRRGNKYLIPSVVYDNEPSWHGNFKSFGNMPGPETTRVRKAIKKFSTFTLTYLKLKSKLLS